ncbi:unnamed protein product [Phaedon cochleariae]|uniref:DUF4806 domain-containing protein n=1 Tax=Phaedon cochleariae TaxID=80249 RepID=A0A9P0GTW9_PHACE|nr:unnamed protein product [Phaedon cochleariae]
MRKQVDELEKAFKRGKEAEVTSDLVDTDIDESTLTRQPRKTYKKVIESSGSEEERYSRPPKIKIKKLSGAVETKHPNYGLKSVSGQKLVLPVQQSSGQSQHNTQHLDEFSQSSSSQNYSLKSVSGRKLVLPVQQSSEQSQYNTQHLDEFSQPSLSFCAPSPGNNSVSESAIKTLVSMVNQVKEQNKLVIGKLDEIQNTLFNKQGAPAQAQDIKDSFPVQLPLKNIQQLNIFEEHTNQKENLNLLVTHLGSLGGKNIKLRIHKVLRELLTDDLASNFSYYGKRSKEPFYELNINKALLRAVKSEESTISDVEDTIKLWIKHAPDRMRARNKTQ